MNYNPLLLADFVLYRAFVHCLDAYHHEAVLYPAHETTAALPFLSLILSPLEQPLGDLVLLDNVNMCTPAGKRISVNGIEQRL